MRIVIAAVGRLKDGAERELQDRYVKRLGQSGRGLGLAPIDLVEVPEGRADTAVLRQADEAARLLKLAGTCEIIAALDEGGQSMSSRSFAGLIGRHRDNGVQSLAFLIGGPDGQGAEALQKAQLKLSLGPMTLPHGLARIVLAEQLYRAATILANHPYHRD
jgi:23S rRNA (pseudouridine1915-N3)-methyltransferase